MVVWLVLRGTPAASLAAAAVFAVGAGTDRLDGYLARRTATVTRTGAVLDPIADKLLVVAPVLTLVAVGRFPLWAAVVIVGREVAVSGLRAWLARRGRDLPVSPLGKLKTTTQLVAILLYLLPLTPAMDPFRFAVLAVAVAMTVWSGLDYAARATRPREAA